MFIAVFNTEYFQSHVNICRTRRPLLPLQVACDSLKPHDLGPIWSATPKNYSKS